MLSQTSINVAVPLNTNQSTSIYIIIFLIAGLSDESEVDKVFLHVFFVSPNSVTAGSHHITCLTVPCILFVAELTANGLSLLSQSCHVSSKE